MTALGQRIAAGGDAGDARIGVVVGVGLQTSASAAS